LDQIQSEDEKKKRIGDTRSLPHAIKQHTVPLLLERERAKGKLRTVSLSLREGSCSVVRVGDGDDSFGLPLRLKIEKKMHFSSPRFHLSFSSTAVERARSDRQLYTDRRRHVSTDWSWELGVLEESTS